MDSFTTTSIPVEGSPWHVVMAPDGSRVYVTHIRESPDLSNVVSVIDTTQNAVVATIYLDSLIHDIALSPDGAHLYASHFESQKVSVIATATNVVVTAIPLTEYPTLLAAAPDGGRVYVAHGTGVSAIDTTTYSVERVIYIYPVSIEGLAVAPHGGRLYIARAAYQSSSGLLQVFDTTITPPTVVNTILMSRPTSIAVSPDGSRCYVINEGEPPTNWKDELWVIDTTTNGVLERISLNSTLASVAVAPNRHRLYATTGAAPADVVVIDTTTNAVVTSVPLDGQGSDLAVTARDGTVHHIYVASPPLHKVSHTVSVASFETGQLLSYGDAGTIGNVSDPLTVGLGGWQSFKFLFSGTNLGGENRIYAVDSSGQLLSYGDAGTSGNVSNPVVVGFGGWQDFKFVFAGRNVAGENRIYAVDQNGQLLSYGDAGTPGNVSSPVVVGFGGWQSFTFLFSGRNVAGENRIYAVDQSGQLLSYGDAGTPGNVSSPVVVGLGGWLQFTFLFAGRNLASEDRIYAVVA